MDVRVIEDLSAPKTGDVFIEQIYNGTIAETVPIEGGFENYSYWEFQFSGLNGTVNTLDLKATLDGVTYFPLGFVNILDGVYSASPTVDGLYRFGTINDQDPIVQVIKGFQITHAGSTPAAASITAIGKS